MAMPIYNGTLETFVKYELDRNIFVSLNVIFHLLFLREIYLRISCL